LSIVKAPEPEIIRVSTLINDAVEVYVKAFDRLSPDPVWETPILASSLLILCIRNVEAVTLLAMTDEVLAPAAWANARNAFDVATRVVWLLYPPDPMDCEMRWIELLAKSERAYDRMAGNESNDLSDRNRLSSDSIALFRRKVEEAVPAGYTPHARIPSTKEMLQEIGAPGLYTVFVEGSQFLHGTLVAASVYVKNLGTEKRYGEFTGLSDWILPLRVCWISLKAAGTVVIRRLSNGSTEPEWKNLASRIDVAFHDLAVAAGDGARQDS
jgi:hypothetical protein